MAWIVRNKDGVLLISDNKPERINHLYEKLNLEYYENERTESKN